MHKYEIDGLMQERRNSIGNALELVFLALTRRNMSHFTYYPESFLLSA